MDLGIIKNENNKQNLNVENNKSKISEFDWNLKLGYASNNKKKEMFIPENSRCKNLLILGNKGSGKTTKVYPFLAEQEIANKEVGGTFIVTKKDMAYTLYVIAKKYKRKVTILKPSVNNNIDTTLLWDNHYNYDYINEFIINYKEALKKKDIVIIDMEVLKYKTEGIRTVGMLLLQLQLDMQETDITQRRKHSLFVDDAYFYLPFLEYLLEFNDYYNLSITLFFQSRNQFIQKNKDYSSLIDNNIRNIILLNSLNISDINYYKERMYEIDNPNIWFNRNSNSLIYEIVDYSNKRRVGQVDFNFELDDDIEDKAKKARAKLLKIKRKEKEDEIINSIKNNLAECEIEYEYEENNNLKDKEPTPIDVNEIFGVTNNSNDNIPADDNTDTDEVVNNNCNENCSEEVEQEPTQESIKEEVEKTKQENLAEKKELTKDDIRQAIINKEKEKTRKVSSKIFNSFNANISVCTDFDFEEDF